MDETALAYGATADGSTVFLLVWLFPFLFFFSIHCPAVFVGVSFVSSTGDFNVAQKAR